MEEKDSSKVPGHAPFEACVAMSFIAVGQPHSMHCSKQKSYSMLAIRVHTITMSFGGCVRTILVMVAGTANGVPLAGQNKFMRMGETPARASGIHWWAIWHV